MSRRTHNKPKRHNHHWTNEEEDALRSFFGEYSDRQIAILLDRTTNGVLKHRHILGLHRSEQPAALKGATMSIDAETNYDPFADETGLLPATPPDRPRPERQAIRWYLAGRISPKDDWRAGIVKGIEGDWKSLAPDTYHKGSSYIPDRLPVLRDAVMGHRGWDYVGPFYRKPQTYEDLHGDIQEIDDRHGGPACDNHGQSESLDTVRLCVQAIWDSDILFAWIEDLECYGTLVEIGLAKAWEKPVVIAFHENLEPWGDLWFCRTLANHLVWQGVRSAREAFIWLLNDRHLRDRDLSCIAAHFSIQCNRCG